MIEKIRQKYYCNKCKYRFSDEEGRFGDNTIKCPKCNAWKDESDTSNDIIETLDI